MISNNTILKIQITGGYFRGQKGTHSTAICLRMKCFSGSSQSKKPKLPDRRLSLV